MALSAARVRPRAVFSRSRPSSSSPVPHADLARPRLFPLPPRRRGCAAVLSGSIRTSCRRSQPTERTALTRMRSPAVGCAERTSSACNSRYSAARRCTGSWFRNRSTSLANPLAVSYRRSRSFASAFITIQSSSPRTNRPSFAGSVWRLAATLGFDVGRAQPAARRRRLLLADHPQHLVEGRLLERLARRSASCRSAVRRGSRRGRRCRPACPRPRR